MTAQNLNNLTLEQAQKLLTKFSCVETNHIESLAEKELLRQSLLLLTDYSDYQNFGICADVATAGFQALETYLKALGYEQEITPPNLSSVQGTVYIKFNTKKWSYYIEPYTGKYRGVLISCQSSEYETVNGTYGHLPLDLFS